MSEVLSTETRFTPCRFCNTVPSFDSDALCKTLEEAEGCSWCVDEDLKAVRASLVQENEPCVGITQALFIENAKLRLLNGELIDVMFKEAFQFPRHLLTEIDAALAKAEVAE